MVLLNTTASTEFLIMSWLGVLYARHAAANPDRISCFTVSPPFFDSLSPFPSPASARHHPSSSMKSRRAEVLLPGERARVAGAGGEVEEVGRAGLPRDLED